MYLSRERIISCLPRSLTSSNDVWLCVYIYIYITYRLHLRPIYSLDKRNHTFVLKPHLCKRVWNERKTIRQYNQSDMINLYRADVLKRIAYTRNIQNLHVSRARVFNIYIYFYFITTKITSIGKNIQNTIHFACYYLNIYNVNMITFYF